MPVIVLTGPRQSGKSTLVRHHFGQHPYRNLERPDERAYASADPVGFLAELGEGGIVDEVQRAPQLLSYVQVAVDEDARPGRYLLTGSQNFQLLESVSQSLAGRAAVLTLLPFSVGELADTPYAATAYEDYVFRGFYPRIYDQDLRPERWLTTYVATYLERDLRTMTNVHDLGVFRQFMAICAGRIGQLINFSDIGSAIGLSYQTVKKWISLLETSYLAFRLRPYHKSYEKRIVKSSKLYFYDPGLASNLLGITAAASVGPHFARGGLFECLVIAELLKAFANRGERPGFYFWNAAGGKEVDLLIDRPDGLVAVEIKSSRTVHSEFFAGLTYFQGVSGIAPVRCFLVYGGDDRQRRSAATVVSWRDLAPLFEVLWPEEGR